MHRVMAAAKKELRSYPHGVSGGRAGNQGFVLHESGGDAVWDTWAQAVDDLFPESEREMDGPHMHPGMPEWYITYFRIPE